MISEEIILKSSNQKSYPLIIKIGLYCLILQNILVPLAMFVPVIYLLDLVGFFILGIGFLIHSQPKSYKRHYFLIAGGCILGWIICRISSQFIIPNLLLELDNFDILGHVHYISYISELVSFAMVFGYYEAELPSLYSSLMSFSFIVGGLFLCGAFILIWFTEKKEWRMKKSYLFLLGYSLLNVIVIFLIVLSPSGVFFTTFVLLKVTLVPLLGVVGFGGMLKKPFKKTLF